MTVRVADVAPCEKCNGPLLPILACNTCGYVSILRDTGDVDRFIACSECTATNEVQWLCDRCHARYPFEGAPTVPRHPRVCPSCATFLGPDDSECPTCGERFESLRPPATPEKPRRKRRIKGRREDRHAQEIRRLPGVSELQARALLQQGYDALWKLWRASEDELALIPELGRTGARTVKSALRFLVHTPEHRPREAILDEEFECALCSCVTSAFSSTCLECGATFDEEEMDEDVRRSLVEEGQQGLLAFYDLHLQDDPDEAELWYARGLLLEAMGESEEAMRSFDRAASLSPKRKIAVARTRLLSRASHEPGVPDRLREMLRGLVDDTGLDEEMKAFQESIVDREPRCPVCDEPVPPGATVCPACSTILEKPRSAERSEREKSPEMEILDSLMDELSKPAPPVEPEPTTPASLESMVDKFEETLSQEDLERTRLATVDWLMEELEESIVGAGHEPAPQPEAARRVPPPSAPPSARARLSTSRGLLSKSLFRREGLVNGKGAVNGRGHVNGYINGAGKVNGFINGRGRVNGFINGRGYVNGSSLTVVRLPTPPRRAAFAAIAVGLLLVVVILGALLAPTSGPASPILIDGSFQDWAAVPTFDAATPAKNPNVAIDRYASLLDRDDLYLYAKMRGTTFGDYVGYDAVFFLIDADGNASTGFLFSGLGADYAVEVDGGNESVAAARLYSFPPDAELNWSRRQAEQGVTAASSGQGLEVQVSLFDLSRFDRSAFRVGVYADDFDGASSRSEAMLSAAAGAILLESHPFTTVVGIGATDLMEIRVRALGLVSPSDTWFVSSFQLNATAGLTTSLSAESVNLTRDRPSAYIRVTVQAPGFFPGAVVGVEVVSATAARPVFVVGGPVRAYVTAPPPEKRVDGLFDDWTVDALGDVDSSRVNNSNVDISRFGSAQGLTTAFFYVQVVGNLFEGGVPQHVLKVPRGSGGGGSSGNESRPQRQTGEDLLRVYTDTNVSDGSGFLIDGIRADYFLELKGLNGRVTAQTLFHWSNGWVKMSGAAVSLSKNDTSIEGSFAVGAAANDTQVVFVMTDWAGISDLTMPSAPVGGVPLLKLSMGPSTLASPGLIILSGNGAETVLATSLINVPSVDGNCSSFSGEYQGASTASNSNLRLLIGRLSNISYVYACVDVTADGTNDGTNDWGELLFDAWHNATASPEDNDRRFRVESGASGNFSQEKGDGGSWIPCGASCDNGNAAKGKFNASNQVYEFKIRFSDMWGTNSPATNATAGFAIVVFNKTGPVTYTWGATDVNEFAPSTWGHLDIPEFSDLFFVVATVAILVAVLRRRRS